MVWIFGSETRYCFARAREFKGFFHSNSLVFHSLNDKFSVFPLIYSQHQTIFWYCYCKKHVDVSLLFICPLIGDKFSHNIQFVKVYCGTTLTML